MSPGWPTLILAIVLEVVATSSLKASKGFTVLWPSVIVVVGYAAAFFLLSQTLRHLSIGVAYAVWSGVGTALLAVIGTLVFRETLSLAGVLGIALIVVGVVLLNLGGVKH